MVLNDYADIWDFYNNEFDPYSWKLYVPINASHQEEYYILPPDKVDLEYLGLGLIGVTIELPSYCYQVSSWGNVTRRNGTVFSVDVKICVNESLYCAQAVKIAYYIYVINLSELSPGEYEFQFKVCGVLVKNLTFNVTGIPPTAIFVYFPANPTVGETVTFDASLSFDIDGSIVSYYWDFGDGNVTTTTEPIVNHTYSSPGNYNVTLVVTDNHGLIDSTSKIIPVQEQIEAKKEQLKQQILQLILQYLTKPREDLKHQILQLILQYIKL